MGFDAEIGESIISWVNSFIKFILAFFRSGLTFNTTKLTTAATGIGPILDPNSYRLWIVIMVVGAISGGLGCILGLIWPVAMIAVLVLHIVCIVKGLKGERLLIPGISEFADRF